MLQRTANRVREALTQAANATTNRTTLVVVLAGVDAVVAATFVYLTPRSR